VRRLRHLLVTFGRERMATPGERALAGRISGVLWLGGAATLVLTLVLPGRTVERPWAVLIVVAISVAWGTVLLLEPWGQATREVSYVSTAIALAGMAVLVVLTGGANSPAREYVWFVVVYAAFFFPPRIAFFYWLACGLVNAIPLAYDADSAIHEANLVRTLVVVVPIYCLVGGVIVTGRDLLIRATRRAADLEAQQRARLEEQSALRRVATAVAAGTPPAGTFALVSSEAGRLLGADAAAIVRFQDQDRSIALGRWAREGAERSEPGGSRSLAPGDALWRLRDLGTTVREDDGSGRHHSRVAAPVHVGASLWGALLVAAHERHAFPDGAESRLTDFADLIATAVANAEDRAHLQTQAATDVLTGLPNQRAFRERLEDEVARARRHGRPLTIALIDIDRFRELNDRVGLESADRILEEVGSLLRRVVREEDVVARMGGDEYGMIFMECDRHEALIMSERVRRTVAEAALRHHQRATVSIGLCDLEAGASADELLRRAGAALYWAKEHGRDVCWVYDHAVVRELEDGHVAARDTDSAHALVGLRALARAIDAKDAATQEHSERVAATAARLATARGWPDDRVARLRDAALLHDVGKIGIPDAILLKPAPLTDDEYARVREHPLLGARIVGDVLDDEQVSWIAGHHERPDGTGYPDGVDASALSEGAALLALADAWDAMVSERSYSPAMAVEDALREARSCAGTQFDRSAVAALEAVASSGSLGHTAARLHQPTAVR
jgi:diguanylate cyclase (GGDEF)-like protein